MDFWLTDDQQALADNVAAFVANRFPRAALPDAEGAGPLLDLDAWRELASLGVFSLQLDGFGVREAVLVFEQLGRGLVPGPLVGTHLAAGLVDGAAEGSTLIGLLEESPAGALVEHAPNLGACLAFGDSGVTEVAMASLDIEPVPRSLDAGAPVWRATLRPDADVTTLVTGDEATRLRLTGVALVAALQLGVAVGASELATAYAKEREQFGRPIGGFQAVKHLCADMLVRAEVARAAVYAAACALDGASDDDPAIACHVAKAVAGEAALANGRYGIQVHGGMGFTWEVHAQRYWKRAVTLDATLGGADEHAEHVADQL
jgi:alkylation response protein AidB-like acyl-CoA dehydrogenase